MKESKLWELLSPIKPKDLEQLGLLIESPYFNQNQKLVPLFKAIKIHLNKPIDQVPDKASFYAKIFPNESYHEKALGYLMTDLVRLVEEWMVQERLKDKKILHHTILLEVYNDQRSDAPYRSILKKARKEMKAHPYRNSDFYFDQFLLDSNENRHFDKNEKHTYDLSLQRAVDHLDLYYLGTKLRYLCEMVNRQKVIVSSYDLKMMEEILQYLKDHPESETPPIIIYRLILRAMLEENNPDPIIELIELLPKNAHLFPKIEARVIYLYGVNLCVSKVHSGKLDFLAHLFKLYQEMIAEDLILDGAFISQWSYINIVSSGVRNGAFEWTKDFIHQYKNKLEKKFRTNAYTYSLAFLYFHLEAFDDALVLLNKVEFKDVFYNLESKHLLLKIYYEKNQTEPLLSLAEAFKAYLKRNRQLTASRKLNYKNTIRFISRLSKIDASNKRNLQRLKEQINQTESVMSKEWIEKKLRDKLNSGSKAAESK